MDLSIAFLVGFLALPWMWMGALVLLFIVDVALTESEAFGWATFSLIGGTGLVAWLGGGVNVFSWAWANLDQIFTFLIFYFLIGGLWSVAKWYFYLLKVRDRLELEITEWGRASPDHVAASARTFAKPSRPNNSFATNNKGRLMGWIGHWPFSMIGSLFGDVLTRIVRSVYEALRSVYDLIGDHVFADFDKAGDKK